MDMKVSEMIAAKLDATTKVIPKKVAPDFAFTLSKLDEEGLSLRLSSLIEEIKTHGGKLIKHRDIADMKQYRRLITQFLQEIVPHSHEFKRDNFLDRRGRHRVFGIIKLINQNLDELAQQLINSETATLDILEKIGEIEGLILDLFV